jgi:hypothetical protein
MRRQAGNQHGTPHARELAGLMRRIVCVAGHTQIAKVLAHARQEHERQPISALIIVGDAVEEAPDTLYPLASKLGVPAFMFQEGNDATVTEAFKEIAKRTGGAHCRFDPGAARELGELLRAVAAYAAGGTAALAASDNAGAVKLLGLLKPGK